MIKSLKLHNFQSHQDTTLEFDPRVNVIVGASDSGKTAIIRALRWLRWNRPLGDEFRSTWGGDTSVSIDLGEHEISRLRTKDFNGYVLGINDVFEATKGDVPTEITDILNIGEINLQQQLDSPFLLSESPGAVAEHFNHVAHLDQIDLGLRNVQSWIRQLEQDIKSDERRRSELEEELKQFEHLEQFEVEVEVLEGLEQDMIQKINHKRQLQSIVDELNQIFTSKQALQSKISMEVVLIPILEATERKRAKMQEVQKLKDLVYEIEDTQKVIESWSTTTEMEREVSELIILYQKRRKLKTDLDNLNILYNNVEDTHMEYDTQMTKLKAMEKTFHNEFPDICPLCGKPK